MKPIKPNGNVEQFSYERSSQAQSLTCLPRVRKKMLTFGRANLDYRRMAFHHCLQRT